jgi:AcrR family transcriptional regulator
MTRTTDRRVTRTREALQQAFTRLFFQQGYEAFTVSDVAEHANVGRSTFYEHFDSKEDVLWACLSRMFAVFAETIASDVEPPGLTMVLEHLWQNRRHADAIFTGAAKAILSRSLAGLIETELRALGQGMKGLAPLRLASIQLAEAQLALTEAWLRGKAAATPTALAASLHASSRAGARALIFGLDGKTP